MAITLPELTRQIDDKFTETWYEIKPEAQDNILDAIVVWAALKGAGCMTTQKGSDFITRTVGYGEQAPTAVNENSLLPTGEPELETVAFWDWRFEASHVQRNIFQDRANSGPSRIKPYLAKRMRAAREGFMQKFETNLFRTHVAAETGLNVQGLNDMLPPSATVTSGTYGKIARPGTYAEISAANGVYEPAATATNPWWGPKYKKLTFPVEVHLLDDMRILYNSVHKNQSPPNLIISDQSLFEAYEGFGVEAAQIIKDEATRLMDLGFEVFRFKSKPMIWTENMTSKNMMFLNTEYIEIVHDPGMWFDATEWKAIARQGTRIQHLLCALNVISDQLRRHGLLEDPATWAF